MKKKLTCILLIDDDEPTNYINRLTIEENGYAHQVQVASGGQEALDYLTNSGSFIGGGTNYPRPDLIFLDINMPGMDGWEFLNRYKNLQNEQKGNIVMVMLTTSLNPDDEMVAKQNPEVRGFEHKPLTREMLDNLIARFFPGFLREN